MRLLDKNDFNRIACDFTETSPANRVPADLAIRPDLAGMRIYDAPLLGFADAADPWFEELRKPGIVGPHFVTPREWLPEAQSVISFFMPLADAVVKTNRRDRILPSDEWLHGRIEGQAMTNALGAHLEEAVRLAGHDAVYPSGSDRFWSRTKPDGKAPGADVPGYTSNWSERHVAFVCGLGTFGLSAGLITRRGVAGRFGSVVTTIPIPADARPYVRYDEYCVRCGACAKNCFVEAISLEKGKDKPICDTLMEERKIQYKPRFGCGKCNVNVPCERGIPGRTGETKGRG